MVDVFLPSPIDLRHSYLVPYTDASYLRSSESYSEPKGYGDTAPLSCSAPVSTAAPALSSPPAAHPQAAASVGSRGCRPPQRNSPYSSRPRHAIRSRGRNRVFRDEDVDLALALAKQQSSTAKYTSGPRRDFRVCCTLCEKAVKTKSISRHFKTHRARKQGVCCGVPRPGGGAGKKGREHACWKVFSRPDALGRHILAELKKEEGCRGTLEEMEVYWDAHGDEFEFE